jgi:3-isopropylmalate/(R)-2-methylmalate dehydratase small subunit
VSPEILANIFEVLEEKPNASFIVDLKAQKLIVENIEHEISFEINNYKKTCLLNGYDDIDYLLSQKEKISQFEKLKNA